ncbi:hypothetical protein HXA35_01930 [Bacillus sp. A301a_S52]|nr:hypothetical protein [Bacillus sp. A301a_S52]
MNRKLIIGLIGSVIFLIIGWGLTHGTLKDDMGMIEKEVKSLYPINTRIIHIEILEDNYALAFYESDNTLYMGVMELKKTLFGWEFLESVLEPGRINSQLTELSQYSVIYGYADSDIGDIEVELQNGKTFPLQIMQGDATAMYWVFYSDEEDLSGAKVTGINRDGDIQKIQIPDEPSGGAVTQFIE